MSASKIHLPMVEHRRFDILLETQFETPAALDSVRTLKMNLNAH